jgi:serine/threonine-protein kinase
MQHRNQPPKRLGRFEVGAKIGGGGMATVYLGRDVREDGTEELVALKVIHDELAHDEQFTAMFMDEARILARLSHPNVIQTLEYGIKDGHRFIAMELLNGRTVADVWDVLIAEDKRFDLGTATWICARVAEGAHSAHELVDDGGAPLSVIHRDVNPTNIFLTHTGEVKLIDFGLARARVRASKSAEGIVRGKFPYLAPEQAHGQPIDRRIDIYALGTTLWEMASMKRLFKRDNDIETLKAIREAHVPNLCEEDPSFPEALWRIIDRALRRNRDERYGTAEEMRRDLDAFARSSGPHMPKLAALVAGLFPGGEARQAKWLRDAASVRITSETIAPPALVPMASSSLLKEQRGEAASSSAAKMQSKAGSSDEEPAQSRPPASRSPEKKAKSKSSYRSRRSSRPPSKKAKSLRPDPPKHVTNGERKQRGDAKEPEAAAGAEDKHNLWMIVGAVVVVLVLLAPVASKYVRSPASSRRCSSASGSASCRENTSAGSTEAAPSWSAARASPGSWTRAGRLRTPSARGSVPQSAQASARAPAGSTSGSTARRSATGEAPPRRRPARTSA